ncbi:interleukin 17-like protein [Ylistrum balloti]|uniref:interleukin 17-like protein n=1 Tax=Ylistrum balloti TaxID=509963 RepID=UPI002905BBB2|nr:interleukin 17-like protein [Ylistrum balloti]
MTVFRFRDVVILLCQMTALIVMCTGRPPACREASSDRLKNLTQMLFLRDSHWLTYDAIDIHSEAVIEILPSKITNEIITTCPKTTNSTCPSYMVKETVPTRIPSVIMHTRCACDSCQISGIKGRNRLQYRCEPAHRFLPVLKRQDACVNGEYDYVIVQQRVAVSCHCVRKPLTRKRTRRIKKGKKPMKKKYSATRKIPQDFST